MSLVQTAARACRLLPPASRRAAWGLAAVAAVNGMLEVAGIASLLPVVAMASDAASIQANPWLNRLYHGLGFTHPASFMVFLAAGFMALFVLVNVSGALTTWLGLRFSFDLNHRLSVALLRAWFGRSYAWLLGRHGADLAKAVLLEVEEVVRNVYRPLTSVLQYGMSALLVGLALLAMDPVVSLATGLGLGGLFTVVYRLNRAHLARVGQERTDLNAQRFRMVQEGLSAVKEARMVSRRASLLARYGEVSRRYSEALAQGDLVSEMPRYLTEVLAVGALVGGLVWLALTGRSQAVAWMMVYVMAVWRLVPSLQRLYRNSACVTFFAPALERLIAELEGGAPPVPEGGTRLPLTREVRLRDVRFAYPGSAEEALRGVCLEIPAGGRVALAGETGAGKTTVADLVAGVLEPTGGTVEVDGRPLDPESLPGWHLNVGYVPQEVFLSDDTVAANIALGLPLEEIDPARVERAARAACIHDFVAQELPGGYEARLGERGVCLSGGQRQRIGIARALYHEPQLLILDEATSSLDALTQRRVLESLAEAAREVTILVIAHRLEVVRACDRIYLMSRGEVEASGTWQDLVGESPLFRAMARQEAS